MIIPLTYSKSSMAENWFATCNASKIKHPRGNPEYSPTMNNDNALNGDPCVNTRPHVEPLYTTHL